MDETKNDMSREEISSLLRFYQDSGLDFPISDAAINRFDTEESNSSIAASPDEAVRAANPTSHPHEPDAIEMDPRKRKEETPLPIAKPATNVTIPSDEVIDQAVEIAAAAGDLDALKSAMESFDGCNLKRSARSTVFEGGNRGANLMLIGGCPSRDDDVSGAAFSGADGLMLEKMLAAIGLSRSQDVYQGFCVPWSPPGGSAPTPLHLEICAPFLARQIALASPKFIVVMGNVAARHVLQSRQTIAQLRGKWTTLPNFGIEAIAMFDPAMLRAQPRMKRAAWMDLLAIKAKLDSTK